MPVYCHPTGHAADQAAGFGHQKGFSGSLAGLAITELCCGGAYRPAVIKLLKAFSSPGSRIEIPNLAA
jgi:hypothetical protein